MEVQRFRLANPLFTLDLITASSFHYFNMGQKAVDLVGGCINEGGMRTKMPDGFEHVEGAEGIDVKIVTWIGDGGSHCHLGSKMNDVAEILFPAKDVGDGFKIADIGFVMSDGMPLPEPVQILRCPFARKVVDDDDFMAF